MSKRSKSSAKNEAPIVNLIVEDIKTVCKKTGLNPYDLNPAKYYKNGGKYTEWDFRKAGGMRNIIDAFFRQEKPENTELVLDLKEIRKEYNKLSNDSADIERLHKRIEQSLSNIPKLTGPVFKPKKSKTEIERVVTAVWSDHHIGSDIVQAETSHNYGRVEEARALAALTLNIANYKIQYRDSTRLNLLILGDIIEGQLHGRTSADLLHLQTCRAIHIYPQAIRFLASQYRQIDVHFAVGNHGRDTSVHQTRATAMKYNAMETTIYYAIRMALSEYKNVHFHQPMTPWVIFDVAGTKGYATHGDTNLNPGNPGKKVNIESLEYQVNKINASLKDKDEYKIFVAGHIHQALHTRLSNKTHLILNGALTPPNSFAQTLNIMEAPQVQVMWEGVPGYPVGDVRFIDVSSSGDDKSLDKIIIPFSGL